MGNYLHLIVRPSLRFTSQAQQSKAGGLDWTRDVLSRLLTGTALTVALLLADPSYRLPEGPATCLCRRRFGVPRRLTLTILARFDLRDLRLIYHDAPFGEDLASVPACFTFYCGAVGLHRATLDF